MEDSVYISPQDSHKNEEKVSWRILNNWNQGIIIILTVLGLFSDTPSFGIIGALLAFFVWGPYGFKIANQHSKNPQWGYFYGFAFGLIGIAIYWLWARRTKI